MSGSASSRPSCVWSSSARRLPFFSESSDGGAGAGGSLSSVGRARLVRGPLRRSLRSAATWARGVRKSGRCVSSSQRGGGAHTPADESAMRAEWRSTSWRPPADLLVLIVIVHERHCLEVCSAKKLVRRSQPPSFVSLGCVTAGPKSIETYAQRLHQEYADYRPLRGDGRPRVMTWRGREPKPVRFSWEPILPIFKRCRPCSTKASRRQAAPKSATRFHCSTLRKSRLESRLARCACAHQQRLPLIEVRLHASRARQR